MDVLLLGASGLLAQDLQRFAPPQVRLTATTRADLDVTNRGAIARHLDRTAHALIVNASGYTAVDAAESHASEARATNTVAIGAIGQEAASRGIRVIHFSTDYVFAGERDTPYNEDDMAKPLSVYGRTKLDGEHALRESGASHLIIRTSWMFGRNGRSFVRAMWDRAVAKQKARVVADQVSRPTYSADLAQVTWALALHHATGVLHVANSGQATRYEVAQRVFRGAGVADLVAPCTTQDYPTPATRPAYSVLNTSRLDSLIPNAMRSWTEALDEFIAELRA